MFPVAPGKILADRLLRDGRAGRESKPAQIAAANKTKRKRYLAFFIRPF